jgi:hypothetical protein
MEDTGKWWQGIIDQITGYLIEDIKITDDELKSEKQRVIQQIKLVAAVDEWSEVSRLAKNVIIYDKLIEFEKDITVADVEKMAEGMKVLLDAEFNPGTPGQRDHEQFLEKVAALAPGFDDAGFDDADFSEFGAMKPKSKRRKSKRRKSKKRKSKRRKSKKRKRSSKKSRRRR